MQLFKCCKDCKKRYSGCHAKCEDYLKARAELDEINEIRNANSDFSQYQIGRIIRRKQEELRKRSGGHK